MQGRNRLPPCLKWVSKTMLRVGKSILALDYFYSTSFCVNVKGSTVSQSATKLIVLWPQLIDQCSFFTVLSLSLIHTHSHTHTRTHTHPLFLLLTTTTSTHTHSLSRCFSNSLELWHASILIGSDNCTNKNRSLHKNEWYSHRLGRSCLWTRWW